MNNSQILYFLTVVKYMNMSSAAKELFITQPALSLSISKMEKSLGLKLFQRNGNKILLTHAGQALLEDFRTVQKGFEKLFSDADSLCSEKVESISIGFACSAMLFASFFTNNFLSEYRGTPIQKTYAGRRQIISMLKSQQIDFAVTYYPIQDAAVSNRTIAYEPVKLAVSSHHPLAGRKSVTLEELAETPLIGLTKNHYFRQICDLICAKSHFQPNYATECEYAEANRLISQYANTDKYASFCAEGSFRHTFGSGYVLVPIDDENMYRATTISWLTERNFEDTYAGLIAHIEKNFPEQYQRHLKLIDTLSE
jgi:LysR family transcriptional activator of glutamate synthase operon